MHNSTLHVGMPPFITADGTKLASFQQLNAAGKAVATITIEDGQITQFLAIDSIDRGAFIGAALAMFEQMQATRF